MKEILRDIKGYERLYQVSNLGRIYSFRRGRFMKPCRNNKGYFIVTLRNAAGIPKTHNLHILVATAFAKKPTGFVTQASHFDGDQENNSAENLGWETPKKNTGRRKVHGTERMGEQITHKVKMTVSKVIEARRHFDSGISVGELATLFSLSKGAMYAIVTRKSWKHINY